MKHCTKEWYYSEQIKYLDWQMKKAKHAERKDEANFQTFYRYRLENYLSFERSSDLYRNPKDDLIKLNEFCNAPDLTEAEQQEREGFRKMFLHLNRKRLEGGVYFPFDEAAARRKFHTEFEYYVQLYQHLPQYILTEIADIRMFALGYVAPNVMKLLKGYCKHLRNTSHLIRKKVQQATYRAQHYLTQTFFLEEYNEVLLTGIEKTTDGIRLCFEENETLLIKNGAIVECGNASPIPYQPDDPESGWSKVVASELYYENNLFELHFLISDENERNEKQVWNLTLLGSDIFQISSE